MDPSRPLGNFIYNGSVLQHISVVQFSREEFQALSSHSKSRSAALTIQVTNLTVPNHLDSRNQEPQPTDMLINTTPEI